MSASGQARRSGGSQPAARGATHLTVDAPDSACPYCGDLIGRRSGFANVLTLIGLLPEPATLSGCSVRPSNTTFRLGQLTALHLSALYAASTVVGAGRESLTRDVGENGTGRNTTPVPAAWSALAVTHRAISS
jgi:hypothetical protein